VDNLCHTLVGAALGEAGLKHRTRWGSATLMIAANLPDIDVLVFATNTPAIAFRRGWTHGILAQVVLPVLLALVMWAFGRRDTGSPARKEGIPVASPVSFPWLLVLAYLGIFSHVLLDYLNNYGVRLLAPFDWRWFYGDALFIVDPWLWLSLGAGAWLSWRRRTPTAARGALLFATGYVLVMLLSARAARDAVIQSWRDTRGVAPQALMVGPRPVTPLTRDVIVDAGDHYQTGLFSWRGVTVTFDPAGIPKHDTGAAVREAMRAAPMRAFLSWSRFPFFELSPARNGTEVTVGDMRFAGFGGLRFAGRAARFTSTVTVPAKSE
jgi:inner membrane protein